MELCMHKIVFSFFCQYTYPQCGMLSSWAARHTLCLDDILLVSHITS